ncbi:hypothetical protein JB92DRAFT_3094346 [Gautieria morchelliformis]|nr:hypothetical protein JB92DRAFT_3094346 [Gautieria morchelliformis]
MTVGERIRRMNGEPCRCYPRNLYRPPVLVGLAPPGYSTNLTEWQSLWDKILHKFAKDRRRMCMGARGPWCAGRQCVGRWCAWREVMLEVVWRAGSVRRGGACGGGVACSARRAWAGSARVIVPCARKGRVEVVPVEGGRGGQAVRGEVVVIACARKGRVEVVPVEVVPVDVMAAASSHVRAGSACGRDGGVVACGARGGDGGVVVACGQVVVRAEVVCVEVTALSSRVRAGSARGGGAHGGDGGGIVACGARRVGAGCVQVVVRVEVTASSSLRVRAGSAQGGARGCDGGFVVACCGGSLAGARGGHVPQSDQNRPFYGTWPPLTAQWVPGMSRNALNLDGDCGTCAKNGAQGGYREARGLTEPARETRPSRV